MSHRDDAKQLEIDRSLSTEVYAGSRCACVSVCVCSVCEIGWTFMIMLQSAMQRCNQLNVYTDIIFHGAVMCVRVFRSRWWVRLRKWRGYFDARRWKPTQENTAGTHSLLLPCYLHHRPSIFSCTNKQTHAHTHTGMHARKQAKQSILTQPHCLTLDVGILSVSHSPQVKHPCHPHTHRTTLTENSVKPYAVSAPRHSYICFV